jgi:hypothetical protein
MAARRILAALIVTAVAAGSALAACELFCATDCARATAAAAPTSGCHGRAEAERPAPKGERGCPGVHVVRLAVRDAGSALSIALAPPAFLASTSFVPAAARPDPGVRAPSQVFIYSTSPPPILRV